MTTTYVHLPLPDAYTGADRCASCGGTGVTGIRYEFDPGRSREGGTPVLLADELCPACGGCGRDSNHQGCRPEQHAGWDPHDEDGDEDEDLAAQALPCPSCNGRGWWVCDGFPADLSRVVKLRVACGCSQSLIVPVDPTTPGGDQCSPAS